MANPTSRKRRFFEACRAAIIGIVMAIIGMAFTLVMMGAGHGTMVLGIYLFAPIMLLCILLGDLGDNIFLAIITILTLIGPLVLFATYGVILTVGRHRHRGRAVSAWLLGLHYVAAAFAIPIAPKVFRWASHSELSMMIDAGGIKFMVPLAIFLVLIHVMAIQYAVGVPFFSGRWARQIFYASLVGLVLGTGVFGVNYWWRWSARSARSNISTGCMPGFAPWQIGSAKSSYST